LFVSLERSLPQVFINCVSPAIDVKGAAIVILLRGPRNIISQRKKMNISLLAVGENLVRHAIPSEQLLMSGEIVVAPFGGVQTQLWPAVVVSDQQRKRGDVSLFFFGTREGEGPEQQVPSSDVRLMPLGVGGLGWAVSILEAEVGSATTSFRSRIRLAPVDDEVDTGNTLRCFLPLFTNVSTVDLQVT
jgi:hypothetical protein